MPKKLSTEPAPMLDVGSVTEIRQDCIVPEKLATESPRLVDVRGVAEMLAVSSRHVYRLSDGGLMPKPVKLGGANRWNRQSIMDWIDAGCPRTPKRPGGK